jgi:hypothetical protein
MNFIIMLYNFFRDEITRTLCQKNQGTVKIKQKPVMLGGRTTYRTPSPERTPFQNGIDRQSYLRKVTRKR